MPTALILGVSGQDGAYLSRLLLEKGYRVIGLSREPTSKRLWRLRHVGVSDDVEVLKSDYRGSGEARALLDRFAPQEIYNLAGESSVSRSFQSPTATLKSIIVPTSVWLEAAWMMGAETRFYNAASGDMYGGSEVPVTLGSPLEPRSPYGAAKAMAFALVRSWRLSRHVHACSGVLFNHESPLRAETFVTRKVVAAAVRIAAGCREGLVLGDLSVRRDWGWAPEYMEAAWLTMQQPDPGDVVVATGRSHSLEEFVRAVFERLGLDYREHVRTDPSLVRASEIRESTGDPAQAEHWLKWRPRVCFEVLVERLVDAALANGVGGQR